VFSGALSRIDGVTLSGQQAGLHFLLTLPTFTEAELVERAAKQGVRVHPLSRYCHSTPPLPSTIVVGFAGLSAQELEEAAKLLKTAYETP
jgi:GntR family transcriptional regulator/MocR family aminotransferase